MLGFQRVSPIEMGKIIKEEIPNLPITVSLRVRDKNENEILEFVEKCISIGFSGILVLMGDPSQSGKEDSGQIPSATVKRLKQQGIDSKIDLFLSMSNKPNFSKIEKKNKCKPQRIHDTSNSKHRTSSKFIRESQGIFINTNSPISIA